MNRRAARLALPFPATIRQFCPTSRETMPPTQILISAGEASGDMYAARLAVALRARADVHLFGMGGPRMRDAGVELVADCSEVSLVGIVEIAKKLPALIRVWKRLLGEAAGAGSRASRFSPISPAFICGSRGR